MARPQEHRLRHDAARRFSKAISPRDSPAASFSGPRSVEWFARTDSHAKKTRLGGSKPAVGIRLAWASDRWDRLQTASGPGQHSILDSRWDGGLLPLPPS